MNVMRGDVGSIIFRGILSRNLFLAKVREMKMGNELSVISGLPCISAVNSYEDGKRCNILTCGGSCESNNCEAGL